MGLGGSTRLRKGAEDLDPWGVSGLVVVGFGDVVAQMDVAGGRQQQVIVAMVGREGRYLVVRGSVVG
jgi:hypothetical protein